MRRPPSRGLMRAPHSSLDRDIWEWSHGYVDTHSRRILALHGSCRSRIPARRGRDIRFLPSRLWRRAVAPRVVSGLCAALETTASLWRVTSSVPCCAVSSSTSAHAFPASLDIAGMQIQPVTAGAIEEGTSVPGWRWGGGGKGEGGTGGCVVPWAASLVVVGERRQSPSAAIQAAPLKRTGGVAGCAVGLLGTCGCVCIGASLGG